MNTLRYLDGLGVRIACWFGKDLSQQYVVLLLIAVCILLASLLSIIYRNREKQRLIKRLYAERERHHQDAEKFNYLLCHGSAGFWSMDSSKSRIVEANPALCDMLGWPADDLAGKPLKTVLTDHAMTKIKFFCQNKESCPHTLLFETTLFHASGMEVPVMLSCLAAGEHGPGMVIVTDLSGQKKLELELELELSLFRKAFEYSGNGIVITDPNGVVNYANPGFTRLTGYREDEIIGQSMKLLKSGNQGVDFYRRLWDTILQGGTWSGRIVNRRKDGTHYWESMTIGPIFADDDAISHYVAIKSDISKPVAMEMELTRFRQAVDQSADGFLLTDDRWRVNYANAAWAEMHGYEPGSINSLPLHIFYSPVRNKELPVPFIETIYRDKSFSGQITQWRKDGSHFPCLITATRIALHGSTQNEFMIFAKDISEQEENLQQLQEAKERAQVASQAKSTFLANMSHEIRTPMNAIMGITHLVLESSLNEDQRKKLQMVADSSESLMRIVNDILDYSKIEAGRIDVESRSFDLGELITNVAGILKHSANEKKLELVTVISENCKQIVKGDSLRLRQVLLNLAGNAVKFTEHGKIEIKVELHSTREEHCEASFSVTDTGIGISEKQMATLFESFSQGDVSITRKYGGTGLGLVISQQLVKLMGGEIRVQSEPGKGSVFSFTLPFDYGEEDRTNTMIQEQTQKKEFFLDVLLVEDNAANRQLATMILKKKGHRVVAACHGLEALQILSEKNFDVILMDIQMPVMDGLTATRIIRQVESKVSLDDDSVPEELRKRLYEQLGENHIWIIAMTANALHGDREKFFASGIDDYLPKPYKPEMLQGILVDFMCRKSGENTMEGEDKECSSPHVAATASQISAKQVLEYIKKEYDLDENTAASIVETYKQSLRETLQKLDAAIAPMEFTEIELNAHAVKGALLNIGLATEAECAKSIEFAARNREQRNYKKIVSKIWLDLEPLLGGGQ
jgi:PAS domain S-box-containing protein